MSDWLDFIKQLPQEWGNRAMNYGRDLLSTDVQATDAANQRFPDEPWNSSAKNAFRHSAATGMLAQKLGGGQAGYLASKGAGYLWELLDAGKFMRDAAHREDTLHDLNANAIGAREATRYKTQTELLDALEGYVRNARAEYPIRQYFDPFDTYMTKSTKYSKPTK